VKLSAIAVLVSGRPVRLRKLLPAVLALTPADCQCGSALHQLRVQAARAHLRLYVVITKSAAATVTPLARDAGQHASGIAEDPSGALRAQLRPQGLTAAFVRSDRTVARTVRRVQAGARARLARQFRTLAAASR
jgi:hypothetical protein